jgi:hypothetical protein
MEVINHTLPPPWMQTDNGKHGTGTIFTTAHPELVESFRKFWRQPESLFCRHFYYLAELFPFKLNEFFDVTRSLHFFVEPDIFPFLRARLLIAPHALSASVL